MQAFHYVNSLSESPLTVKEVWVPSFSLPWHFHSECELVLVLGSFGKRIVGDHIGNFMAGDLVFMGPDLPHIWYNDSEYHHGRSTLTAHAVGVYFKPEWLSHSFFGLAEATRLGELLIHAKRGMHISGPTRWQISRKMEALPGMQGLKQVSYFKTRTQKTFSSFVNEMRVSYACKLLLSKDYSVTEICFESGFKNLTNFNKFFKLFTGQSPRNYRSNFRK